MVEHINEFLDCNQGNKDLDGYYQHFLTLLKYAPQGMTQEIKVAHFIIWLIHPMNKRMQALRLNTFAEVLEARKPLEQEIIQQSKQTSNQSQVKDNR